MAELVEQGVHLVEAEQGRFVGRRLGEVPHVVDDGSDLLAIQPALLPEGVHPGAAPLALPGEVIHVEDADV